MQWLEVVWRLAPLCAGGMSPPRVCRVSACSRKASFRVHSNLLLPSLLQAWRSAWSAWCWVLFQGALEPPRVSIAQNMCWETALQSACRCS